MKNDKIKYLSYIEDTKKHHKLLDKFAKEAVKNAIEDSKNKSVEITYLLGEKIVQESPSGEISVIGSITNKRRKVQVGSKSKI